MKLIHSKSSLLRSLLSLVLLLTMAGNAWGEDKTLTEDFEKQSASTTYNGQVTYSADDSNAGMGWYVEHGTVSTTGALTGSNSMHMRAYYEASSKEGIWNGALPYVYSTTAVKGLKSVTFNAAASNTNMKFDTYYSTDGSTWTAIQTTQSLTTTSKSYSFNIPNSSTSTSYYIKIAASSSSTHAASPNKAGNYTFRVDDIVFTYEETETKTLSTIAISGTPTKTTYEAGEALNPAGLVVTGTYSDSSTGTITEGIEWTLDPETLTAGATTCDVMASVGQISSNVYAVTGLTVTAAKTLSSIALSGTPTKTAYIVGENFDPAGITVTANYSDGTNENVTSNATFYGVTEALTAGQTSFETYATYKNVDSDVQNYTITVSKKTPTITIANMTISKDEQATISATTTPAEASLTYTITEGSEHITLNGSTITGVAAGTATVRASYAGNAEYDALNKDFTVTVSNLQTVIKNSFTTGDNSGSHNFTDNTDISFEAFKGNSATAPAISSSYLRLYQNGGYITISGIKGVKIQSIKLTTGSTYASTTVGYCVDNNDAPTTGTTVAKSSTYTISSLNNQSVSIYCLGTDKDSRLDIAYLEVKYTKEDVTLSGIAVGGTYQTEFIQNSTFNHDNAVVTATYSDGDKQDVTSSAVFTTPDLTTTGEKTVTVSCTHGGVTKETTYNINVTAESVISIALSGTYTKVFKTSDKFSYKGVIVTATYNSGRSAAVEDAEFSTPDLSTTGVRTITVSYGGQKATYDIKVIPSNSIFFESFDTNDGIGGNNEGTGSWSGSIATNAISSDNKEWTFAYGNGATQCAKFGTGSAAGSAKTPAISLDGAAKITFKAGAWNGNSEKTTLNLSATSGTLSQTSVEMKKGAWTEYTVYLTGVKESTQITFAASQASNNRFFLDEVLVEKVSTQKVSFWINGNNDDTQYDYYEGQKIEFITAPEEINGMKFVGWMEADFGLEETTDEEPLFVTSAEMKTDDISYYAVYAKDNGDGTYSNYCTNVPEISADITISAAGYSTYYNSKYNYILPDGMTAYSYGWNQNLRKNGLWEEYGGETERNIVPADVALVLKGEPNTTYTLYFTDENASRPEYGNKLKGFDEVGYTNNANEISGDVYYYGLSLNTDGDPNSVGFYWMESDGAAFLSAPHKAFLILSQSEANNTSDAKAFLFNPKSTPVESIKAEKEDGKIYDMTGREVKNPKAGLYIVNGVKKYIK